MAESAYLLHLETPVEGPLGAPVAVQGWIAAREAILAVGSTTGAREWLDLHPRPDIRSTHPEWPHVAGFSGRVGTGALTGQGLRLALGIGDRELMAEIALPPVQPPPDHLQVRQVGSVWGDRFYPAGRTMFDQLNAVLAAAGNSLTEAKCILDFGCGCGRILRSFAEVPHQGEVWGCDIDAETIAWNQRNLHRIGRFATNPVRPPSAFDDRQFDVVYCVSVFTHLPEEMQTAWIQELHRIIRPGGLLVPSLHGERYWSQDPQVAATVREQGFAYCTGAPTAGLPDFYMVAYHSIEYIRRAWSPWFEVLAHHPQCIDGAHDAVALRRRPDQAPHLPGT